MAEKEIFDYLDDLVANYTVALDIPPQLQAWERIDKNQIVHKMDKGRPPVVTLDDYPACKLVHQWTSIIKSDKGTILDYYLDPLKANARERTFYVVHLDGHTYTVTFNGPMSVGYATNNFAGGRVEVSQIVFDVWGRKAE